MLNSSTVGKQIQLKTSGLFLSGEDSLTFRYECLHEAGRGVAVALFIEVFPEKVILGQIRQLVLFLCVKFLLNLLGDRFAKAKLLVCDYSLQAGHAFVDRRAGGLVAERVVAEVHFWSDKISKNVFNFKSF